MREILFRGRAYDGKMVLGDLIHRGKVAYIRDVHLGTQYQVDNQTVSQYTGLHDANDKQIYEGDVLLLPAFTIDDETFPSAYAVVVWGDGGWEIRQSGCRSADVLDADAAENAVVAGNIWDTPELMEVAGDV